VVAKLESFSSGLLGGFGIDILGVGVGNVLKFRECHWLYATIDTRTTYHVSSIVFQIFQISHIDTPPIALSTLYSGEDGAGRESQTTMSLPCRANYHESAQIAQSTAISGEYSFDNKNG